MTIHEKNELNAWIELSLKGHVHYAQEGDVRTQCGMNAKLVKHTSAKDFVNCPQCKQGTIRI
jgi:hypothetical protein